MQMVNQGLRATSKSSLKLQCLFCAKGDLKEAKELYDFFASDATSVLDGHGDVDQPSVELPPINQ